ncbi:hypothetical protein E2C01_058998 [Portunus trituberculatus]|uniref:Uncharacterized protein n=1 Tax=Portunus trituberculatus TaxID=210409 RepID=A0A5B7H4N6_PORTR|nr:hypothetical protein [Portunus trituberculatus]
MIEVEPVVLIRAAGMDKRSSLENFKRLSLGGCRKEEERREIRVGGTGIEKEGKVSEERITPEGRSEREGVLGEKLAIKDNS